ncbi:MAG: hypothetical protein ACKO3R_02025 [bacterium]
MTKKYVLITGIGNNDPYTSDEKINSNNPEVGPSLSLIAKYLPEYLILFTTEKILKENRLELFKLSIHEIYKSQSRTKPELIEINLSGDSNKEEYHYQKVLAKVVKELKKTLNQLQNTSDINFTYIFSKTAATPQLKNALEIYPRLFLEDNYEIITKERLFAPDKSSLLNIEKFSSQKITEALFHDTKLKAEITQSINNVSNELTEQKFYGLLESFRYLIKSHEYSAALEILNLILNYENSLDTLNIPKKILENHKKLLMIAIELIGFQLPKSKNETDNNQSFYYDLLQGKYLEEGSEIKSFFKKLIDKPNEAKISLAYENILIFRKKALSKEFALGFLILFERLRKNDLISSLKENKLENEIKLSKDEKILSLGEDFKRFVKEYNGKGFLSIEIEEAKYCESLRTRLLDGEVKNLEMPILALALDYLNYRGVNNNSIDFYNELVIDKELREEYKKFNKLRNKLAHDFTRIDSSYLESRLLDTVKNTFKLESRIGFYKLLNNFILKNIFGFC